MGSRSQDCSRWTMKRMITSVTFAATLQLVQPNLVELLSQNYKLTTCRTLATLAPSDVICSPRPRRLFLKFYYQVVDVGKDTKRIFSKQRKKKITQMRPQRFVWFVKQEKKLSDLPSKSSFHSRYEACLRVPSYSREVGVQTYNIFHVERKRKSA